MKASNQWLTSVDTNVPPLYELVLLAEELKSIYSKQDIKDLVQELMK